MIAQLVPLNGGKPVIIRRDLTVVGRQPGVCDLIINRTSVSKLHCLIVKTDGLLLIRDLGSTNGTKVNGQKVLRGALLPGDELSFAGEKFRVSLGPGNPPPESSDIHEARTEAISAQDLNSLLDQGEAAAKRQSRSDVRPLADGEDEDVYELRPLD